MQPLEPEKYYHIFNHAVGGLNLFNNEGNNHFFLEKYKLYISPLVDTYAYCLMPNHFHFAVRIKGEEEIIKNEAFPKFETLEKLSLFISKQLSNFFSCYTQAFNKQQQRRGGLFEKNFRRIHIDSDEYFKQLIRYIHKNPLHHKFVKDFRNWEHSSYKCYFSDETTFVERDEGIAWFNDKKNFEEYHLQNTEDRLSFE